MVTLTVNVIPMIYILSVFEIGLKLYVDGSLAKQHDIDLIELA